MIGSLEMYEKMFGKISDDMVVMAKCNCANCVNCAGRCACNCRGINNNHQMEWEVEK